MTWAKGVPLDIDTMRRYAALMMAMGEAAMWENLSLKVAVMNMALRQMDEALEDVRPR